MHDGRAELEGGVELERGALGGLVELHTHVAASRAFVDPGTVDVELHGVEHDAPGALEDLHGDVGHAGEGRLVEVRGQLEVIAPRHDVTRQAMGVLLDHRRRLPASTGSPAHPVRTTR